MRNLKDASTAKADMKEFFNKLKQLNITYDQAYEILERLLRNTNSRADMDCVFFQRTNTFNNATKEVVVRLHQVLNSKDEYTVNLKKGQK
jgi:hypothetical protein